MSEKKPPALNIYRENAEMLIKLSEQDIGAVMKAAFLYYLYEEEAKELSPIQALVYSCLKSGLDRSAEKYRENCEKKRLAIEKRWEDERKKE